LLGTDNYIIDGVEIYGPAIQFIINKYRTVYNINAINFPFNEDYDLIIMGDVLEHLEMRDAQIFVQKALQHCKQLLVAVPFMYKQGPVEENVYEMHLQEDLNFQTMKERYPDLNLLLYIEDEGCPFYSTGYSCFVYAYYIAKGALYNE
jgi:hypothetical protein